MNSENAVSSPSEFPQIAPQIAPVAKKRRWPLIVGGIVVAVPIFGVAAAYGAYSSWAKSEAIAPNVSINGQAIGGLNRDEAVAKVQERFGRLFVTIQTSDKPFKVSLGELGGKPMVEGVVAKAYQIGRDGGFLHDFLNVYGAKAAGRSFALPVEWDKEALKSKLYVIDAQFRAKPENARLQVTPAGVQVVPEKVGRALNVGDTAAQLQKKYFPGLQTLDATTRNVEPKVTAASLEGTDYELGTYKTHFNPGERGRSKNVRTAAQAIDGQVVMPGENFSFNHCTGERTADKGYKMAHIFITKPGAEEAEMVDGLAGGTCQVSSTLFNAVRKTNLAVEGDGGLKITERNHHSLPVTYVPHGLDATVAWPGKDFRFRNTFSHPIYLRTVVEGAKLSVSVWARVTAGSEAPKLEEPQTRVATNPSQ